MIIQGNGYIFTGNDLGRGSYAMARVRDAFQSMYHRLCRRLTKNKGNTAAIEG